MTVLAPFFLIGLPVLTILAVGLMGRTRRIGAWGAILISLVLTPVGGFIAAIFSGAKRPAWRKAKRKKK
jgi:phosphate/sulfate permease